MSCLLKKVAFYFDQSLSSASKRWCIDRDCVQRFHASQQEKRSNTGYAFSRRSVSSHSPRLHHDRTRNPFCAWPTPKNDLVLLSLLLSFIFSLSLAYSLLSLRFFFRSCCIVIGNVRGTRFHTQKIDRTARNLFFGKPSMLILQSKTDLTDVSRSFHAVIISSNNNAFKQGNYIKLGRR